MITCPCPCPSLLTAPLAILCMLLPAPALAEDPPQPVNQAMDSLRADPQDADARAIVAGWYWEEGEVERARAEARALLRLRPSSHEGHLILGLAGEGGEALAHLRALRPLEGKARARMMELLRAQARARSREENHRAAIESLRELVALAPTFGELLGRELLAYGEQLVRAGLVEEGLEALHEAHEGKGPAAELAGLTMEALKHPHLQAGDPQHTLAKARILDRLGLRAEALALVAHLHDNGNLEGDGLALLGRLALQAGRDDLVEAAALAMANDRPGLLLRLCRQGARRSLPKGCLTLAQGGDRMSLGLATALLSSQGREKALDLVQRTAISGEDGLVAPCRWILDSGLAGPGYERMVALGADVIPGPHMPLLAIMAHRTGRPHEASSMLLACQRGWCGPKAEVAAALLDTGHPEAAAPLLEAAKAWTTAARARRMAGGSEEALNLKEAANACGHDQACLVGLAQDLDRWGARAAAASLFMAVGQYEAAHQALVAPALAGRDQALATLIKVTPPLARAAEAFDQARQALNQGHVTQGEGFLRQGLELTGWSSPAVARAVEELLLSGEGHAAWRLLDDRRVPRPEALRPLAAWALWELWRPGEESGVLRRHLHAGLTMSQSLGEAQRGHLPPLMNGALGRGRLDLALEMARAWSSESPDTPEPWAAQARLLGLAGKPEQAVGAWRTYTELASDHAGAAIIAGEALVEAGEPLRAEVFLQGALRLDPSQERAQLGLLWAALRTGRSDDTSYPHRHCPHRLRAKAGLMMIQGLPEQAANALASSVSLDPAGAETHYLAGRLYLSLGEWGRAVSELGLATAILPLRASFRADMARAMLYGGDMDGALAQASLAVRTEPDNVRAQMALAEVEAHQGHHDRAVDRLSWVASATGNMEASLSLGLLLSDLGRPQAALRAWRRAARSGEGSRVLRARSLLLLARALEQKGLFEQAGRERRALGMMAPALCDGDGATVGRALEVDRLLDQGRPDKAASLLKPALGPGARLPWVQLRQGMVAARLGQRDLALSSLETASRQGTPQERSTALWELALVRLGLGEAEAAGSAAREAARLQPLMGPQAAWILVQTGKGPGARELLGQAKGASPWASLGRAMMEGGLEGVIKEHPGFAPALTALAAELLAKGEAHEARRMAQRALYAAPSYTPAYLVLAKARLAEGDGRGCSSALAQAGRDLRVERARETVICEK